MIAQENPKNERGRGEVFVDKFRGQLDTAVTNCREAEEVTGKVGWRKSYAANTEANRAVVRANLTTLGSAMESIKARGSDEEVEKSIRDAAKMMGEERLKHAAWFDRAAAPYRRAAERLQGLRDGVMREARERETANPLIDRGLADDVREALHNYPSAVWDDEGGTVSMA